MGIFGSYEKFMQFIVDKGLLGSIAGVTIGFIIATAMKSFISDVMMPGIYKLIYLACVVTPLRETAWLNKFFSVTELDFDSFVKAMVNVTFVIIISYFLFMHVFSPYLAVKSANDARSKQASDDSLARSIAYVFSGTGTPSYQ